MRWMAAGMAVGGVVAATEAGAQCAGILQPGDVAAAQFPVISGSGDWFVDRVGAAPLDLGIVAESDGLLTLGCAGTPLDPTTGVLAATVMNTPDRLVQSGDVSGEATLGFQEMQVAGVNYDTVDAAAAFFPYAAGWTAGRFDASGNLVEGNPVPSDPNAPVVTRVGVGLYDVQLPGVANSYTDGMLYAIVDGVGDNFANTRALDPANGSPGTGTWRVRVLDNQANVAQDHPVRFVYLPWSAGVTFGRIGLSSSGATIVNGSGDFGVQRIGQGRARLDLDAASPDSGMLLLMGGNQFGGPDDNIYRYDVDESDSLRRFVVVNRDQPGNASTMEPQDSEFVFTYIPFPVHVVDERQVGATTAGSPFAPGLAAGAAIAAIGDLDGDGVPDQVVGQAAVGGAPGELAVLFMNADGSVAASTAIGSGVGGLSETFGAADRFAEAVSAAGDIDFDGVGDLVVSAQGRNGGEGAIYVLFMNADGTVRSSRAIAEGVGGFTGSLSAGDLFGSALAGIGDLDGDRVPDLVVGARGAFEDPGFGGRGALWVLFLERNGTVKDQQLVAEGLGGLVGPLGRGASFGAAVAAIGDVTGDGLPDVAVGAPEASNDGSALLRAGDLWILALDRDGTVLSENVIERVDAGFDFSVQNDRFGTSVSALGDLNGDGLQDLAVGAETASGDGSGQVYVVYLDAGLGLGALSRIGEQAGGFTDLDVQGSDAFGSAVAALGDLDGDGVTDLSVGEVGDETGGVVQGATWSLLLDGAAPSCADGVLAPSEACDDGDLVPGDGCSITCTIEDDLSISGTAQGGTVSVVIDGVPVEIATFGGQSVFAVAGSLAGAINAEPALAGRGVYGATDFLTPNETLVWTNDRFDGASTTDPGLVIVPEPGFGLLIAVGGLALAAGRCRTGHA